MQYIKKILVWILTLESKLIIRRYKPYIIAVTGSVGKTSTKDAIYDVLKTKNVCDEQHMCFVRKSEKSLNSELGLPLTIIGVPNAWHSLEGWLANISAGLKLVLWKHPYPDCLVLEVGADHPGDIRRVAKWLRPNIAVITRVSRTPVHVEFFKSPEEVFEEKASLAEAVRDSGTVVLFADDEKVMSIAERVKDRGVSVISFGLNETAAVKAVDFATTYETAGSAPTGISFMLSVAGQNQPAAVMGILGQTYLYPLLAAAAVGVARKIDLAVIAKSLSEYNAPNGRMSIIPGMNGTTIIDDTYNSSPDAASSALATLKSLNTTGKRIAILGDMMELGKYAADEHRKIGREVVGAASLLLTVGPRSKMTAEEAVKAGMPASSVQSFTSAEEAAGYARSVLGAGDIILVKGSQSMRMERISKALMAHPERSGELLVRQEREWLEKA